MRQLTSFAGLLVLITATHVSASRLYHRQVATDLSLRYSLTLATSSKKSP